MKDTRDILSIAYHEVLNSNTDPLPPSVLLYSLDQLEFRRHVLSIRQQGRSPVETVAGSRRWTGRIPVFLTFDDGRIGGYTCVADELERHNWRGHFFITASWIGRPGFMNTRQILALHERGHVIGSHSCSHPERMCQLSWEHLRREWGESSARLADILGSRVTVASLPNGYYSPNVARAAAAEGIEVLFTSTPTTRLRNVDGCLVLGRYTILRRMPPWISGAIAAGRFWPRWRQRAAWQAKQAIKAIAGEHYLTVRQFLLERALARSASRT